jgi:hypothetical protein
MQPTGWVLKQGHRIRVSISGGDFPNLWPTPEPAYNRIYFTKQYSSRITLPVVDPSKWAVPKFNPPPELKKFGTSFAEPPMQKVEVDQITGDVSVINRRAGKTVLDGGHGTLSSESSFRCTASKVDPAKASIVGTHRYSVERPDGKYDVVGVSSIRATKDTFHIVIDLTVHRDGRLFFQKQWIESEPRNKL